MTVGAFGLVALLAVLLLALGSIPVREPRRSLPPVDESTILFDHKLLVIPAPAGAPPLDEDDDAIADAKAVTFAFHALILNLDTYDLDYRNFERIDGGWRVLFEEYPSIEDLKELVLSRREFIEETNDYIDDDRAKLAGLEDELHEARGAENASEVDRLEERVRDSRASLENWLDELADLEAELQEHINNLRNLQQHGEAPPIVVDVRRVQDHLRVDALSGSTDSHETELVLGYSERVKDVDVHGVDFYNVTLTSSPEEDLPFNAYGFWTGPIPSTYQEECLLELRSKTGELLWRAPDVHDNYDRAPPGEDRRDGWIRGSDMEGIGVPLDDAVPSFQCRSREP